MLDFFIYKNFIPGSFFSIFKSSTISSLTVKRQKYIVSSLSQKKKQKPKQNKNNTKKQPRSG